VACFAFVFFPIYFSINIGKKRIKQTLNKATPHIQALHDLKLENKRLTDALNLMRFQGGCFCQQRSIKSPMFKSHTIQCKQASKALGWK